MGKFFLKHHCNFFIDIVTIVAVTVFCFLAWVVVYFLKFLFFCHKWSRAWSIFIADHCTSWKFFIHFHNSIVPCVLFYLHLSRYSLPYFKKRNKAGWKVAFLTFPFYSLLPHPITKRFPIQKQALPDFFISSFLLFIPFLTLYIFTTFLTIFVLKLLC